MKTILVIDDEQSFLLALELILKSAGYNVVTAADGEEGLIKFKDLAPDLVLLDIMMPGIGGLETLRIMRSHPKLKNVPILLMSGGRPFVRRSDYTWTGFLLKPFDAEDLLNAIDSALK